MVMTMAREEEWEDEEMDEQADEGVLVLVNEEGESVSFDLLDRFEFSGAEYVAVVPSEAFYEDEDAEEADDDEYDEDEEIVEVAILRVEPADDGENEYLAVDDDKLLAELFEVFHDRHVGEYYFE